MKARHHVPWSVVLLISWVLLFGASGVQRISPASDWMEVRSVRVFDTQAGVSPIMVVDRVIKRPFQGHWVTDVEREQTEGLFEKVCSSNGSSAYTPDNVPPRMLTLGWWTTPVDCTPREPGRYRVDTIWTVELPGGLTKTVRRASNVFTVT